MSRDNIFAFFLFLISTIGFFIWGYKYVPSYHYFLFLLAGVFGLFMAFNIGGNDVANSFGTSVGAKTLTIKQALVIAAIFELSGAIFAGGEVTNTIRSGIISLPTENMNPMLFAAVMMSALLSSGAWLFIATKKGLPVSTTHSIVGGIVGAGIMLGYQNYGGDKALEMIQWSGIFSIFISWIISPLMGGILSYAIFWYIKTKIIEPSRAEQNKLKMLKKERKNFKENYVKSLHNKSKEEQIKILEHLAVIDDDDIDGEITEYKKTIKNMKKNEKAVDVSRFMRKHVPIMGSIGAMVVSSMLLFKGLQNLNFNFTTITTMWIIFVIGTATYLISITIVNMMEKNDIEKSTNRIFSWFQIFTASSFAFSHGANDIANAIGPFAAILDVLKSGSIQAQSQIPSIAMAAFGISLVVGLWFLGKGVITTVGQKLATILPTTGFSAELGASAVILIATKMGLPISSTHVLIGAVLGIGILNKNANWSMLRPIGLAWIITLPIAAFSSAIAYIVMTKLMGI